MMAEGGGRMADSTVMLSGPPHPPRPMPGVGVAMCLVAVILGWMSLAGAVLSETSLFGGLMLLWYWANVEHFAFSRLASSLFGALVGIGLAWGIFYGASTHSPAGLATALLALVVAIYLDITKLLPRLVNPATMLYSIVAAAPLVQLRVDWVEFCVATIAGALYFGSCIAVVKWLVAMLSRRRNAVSLPDNR